MAVASQDVYKRQSQYMPFYKATVLKSRGKNAVALDYYRKLILKSPSKFYLWHQASALVEDADVRIALLCKAISTEKDESFIGRCRIDVYKRQERSIQIVYVQSCQ